MQIPCVWIFKPALSNTLDFDSVNHWSNHLFILLNRKILINIIEYDKTRKRFICNELTWICNLISELWTETSRYVSKTFEHNYQLCCTTLQKYLFDFTFLSILDTLSLAENIDVVDPWRYWADFIVVYGVYLNLYFQNFLVKYWGCAHRKSKFLLIKHHRVG